MRQELLPLSKQLARLTAKRAGVTAALFGEAGIGKTHAANALLQSLAYRTVRVHATQPPRVILQALSPPTVPAWLERALKRVQRGEELSAEQSAEALSGLLSTCAPVLLLIEDLHETSGAPLAVWTQLAVRLRRTQGAALLVTSRVQPPDVFDTLPVLPLDRTASDALLGAEIGAPLPREALAWLYRRAAGNPLFSVEFLRYLIRFGFLWNDTHHWRWREPHGATLPATVEGLIEQAWRQASATAEHDRVLGAKALLGIGASETLWADVAGLSLGEFRSRSADLRHAGVLAGGEFAHPLYHEVIARRLPRALRHELARRALHALQASPCAAAVFVEDAALDGADACAAYEAAAHHAQAEGNRVRAARFLARSVPHRPYGERSSVALQAARQLRHVDVLEAERLAELATQDGVTRTEAVFLLAELLAEAGRGDEAERTLQRLPPEQRRGSEWIWQLVRVRGAANNDAGVLALLSEHPEALENADAAVSARVVRALAHDGRLDDAQRRVARALAAPDLASEDLVQLLKASSVVAYMRGDFVQMERTETRVLALARQLADVRLEEAALYNRAVALEGLGRFEERLHCLELALDVCRELGDEVARAITQTSYATLLLDFAEYERAESLLLEARRVLEDVDLSAYLVGCEAVLSRLYQDWQPRHGPLLAVQHAEAALGYARRRNTARLVTEALCALALAETHAGRAERGETRAREALAHEGALDMPAMRGAGLFALGLAQAARGLTSAACASLQEAQAVMETLGDPVNAHAASLELCRLRRDTRRARELSGWFSARGLANLERRAQRYFPDLSPTSSSPTPSPDLAPEALRLEVLGDLRFVRGGVRVSLHGRRRRELLGALLEARLAGRAELSRLELLDTLYPGAQERDACGALRDVVHQLRDVCSAGAIITTPNGYALGAVSSDAEEFLRTGNAALWRGPYLCGVTFERRDDQVRDTLSKALRVSVEQFLERDAEQAARLGRILLELDPYDLSGLYLTMVALRSLARHRSLTRLYQQARARFREVGEVLPEGWPDFLKGPSA